MIDNTYFTGLFNNYVSKNNNYLNSEISHHLTKQSPLIQFKHKTPSIILIF